MSKLCWLSDDHWGAVDPHLPGNQAGARRVDDRRVISGIIHVLKIGCRWQDAESRSLAAPAALVDLSPPHFCRASREATACHRTGTNGVEG